MESTKLIKVKRMLGFLTDAERLEFSEVSSESRQWSVGIRRFMLICKRLLLNADKMMFKQPCLLNISPVSPSSQQLKGFEVENLHCAFYSRLDVGYSTNIQIYIQGCFIN